MAAPTLVEYATIDTLLGGYPKGELLMSKRYEVIGGGEEGSKSQEKATKDLFSELSKVFVYGEDARCNLDTVLFEAVQNISDHCCGHSDVRLYTFPGENRFLAAFELNEESQFGKEGHEAYRQMLSSTLKMALAPGYEKQLSTDLECDELEGLELFNEGTSLMMRSPYIENLGVADIGGRAYFFFEYNLDMEPARPGKEAPLTPD